MKKIILVLIILFSINTINAQQKKANSSNMSRTCNCCGKKFILKYGWGYMEGPYRFGSTEALVEYTSSLPIYEMLGKKCPYYVDVQYDSKKCAYDCGTSPR